MDYDEHIVEEIESNAVIEPADIAKEVLFLIFGIVGTVANIVLIYIICYFRKLHTTTNTYLVNWAIADIGAAFSSIGYFEIFSAVINIPEKVLYFYYNVEATLSVNSVIFMMLLAVDWCFSAYLPRFVEKFREHTTTIAAAIWVVSAVYLIATSATILLSEHIYIFLLIIFGAFLALVVVLHTIRIVHKIKGSFEYHPGALLWIPTAFIICWLLCWISLVLLFTIDLYIPALAWITDTPVFLHPSINLPLLLFLDKDFRACFFQVFKSYTCCGLIKLPQNREENGVCNES